jgi:hypothetical protein
MNEGGFEAPGIETQRRKEITAQTIRVIKAVSVATQDCAGYKATLDMTGNPIIARKDRGFPIGGG